jgi:hypothetical protein
VQTDRAVKPTVDIRAPRHQGGNGVLTRLTVMRALSEDFKRTLYRREADFL